MNNAPLRAAVGSWDRVEERLQALVRDRARLARLMQIAYWISMGVVLFGAVVAVLVYSGRWTP